MEEKAKIEQEERTTKLAEAEFSSKINGMNLTDQKSKNQLNVDYQQALSLITTEETKKKLESITPGLIEALISLAGVSQTEILARNLKEQKNGLADLFGNSGGINSIRETFKGTALETMFDDLMTKYEALKNNRNK